MALLKEKLLPTIKPERHSVLDRIVSERMSAEEKAEVVDEFLEKLDNQEIAEIKEGEIELSPRQMELVAEANRLIASALKSAGIVPKIEIKPSMVHMVRPDVFERYKKKKGIEAKSLAAWVSIDEQAILVKAEEYDELQFLDRIIHEILHMNSFVSFQTVDMAEDADDSVSIVERRTGLRMKETKVEGSKKAGNKKKIAGKMFFNDLDEAVIEKLAVDIIRNFNIRIAPEEKSNFDKSEKLRKILIEHIRKILQDRSGEVSEIEISELGALYAVLSWQAILLPEAGVFLERYESSQDPFVLEQAISFYYDQEAEDLIPSFAYNPQRVMLDKLMSDILKKNAAKFKNPRDVALLFVKASFEGRVLPLARVIEDTFGKGSFRRLGEGENITAKFSEENL